MVGRERDPFENLHELLPAAAPCNGQVHGGQSFATKCPEKRYQQPKNEEDGYGLPQHCFLVFVPIEGEAGVVLPRTLRGGAPPGILSEIRWGSTDLSGSQPRHSRSMSIRSQVEEMVALAESGDFLGAIERFYAEDATMQENNEPPRIGLPALLENERRALARFKHIHESKAVSLVVDGNRAAINWIFEITLDNGKRFRLDEIAYQEWRGGKIVRERFYYDPAQRAAALAG